MSPVQKRTGVLIAGFGGPDSLDAVGPFMENLMGFAPSDELLREVRMRYLAIGGASPLAETAMSIAEKVLEQLTDQGKQVPVAVGMRYWHPYIQDAVAALHESGCERIIVVSLSPFESKVAQHAYREAIEATASELGTEVVYAPLISEMDGFITYMAGGMATAIGDLEPAEGAIIAFTAHSLPVSELEEDDPYVAGLRRVANAVATAAGMEPGSENAGSPMFKEFRTYGSSAPPRGWYLVYQSKGRKPGEWLGPDLDELIDAAIDSEVKAIIVSPIGFATDHMETLYDLDIVAADKALSNDLEFVRTPVPNDDHRLVSAITEAVVELLDGDE